MSSPKSVDFVRCLKCGKIIKCSRYDVSTLLAHISNDHPEIDIIDTATKRKREFHAPPQSPTSNSFPRQDDHTGQRSVEDCGLGECDLNENDPDEAGMQRQSKQPLLVKDIGLAHNSVTSELLAKYPEIKECEYAPHNPNAQVAYTRRYKLCTPSPGRVDLLQQPFQHTLYRTSIERWCPANGSIYCPKCGSNKQPLIKLKAQRFTRNECGACCLLSCWPFCFIPWILPGQNHEYLYCANCKTFLGLYDRQRNCLRPNRLYMPSGEWGQMQPPEEPSKLKWREFKKTKLLENESPPTQSLTADSPKSTRVSSIIINGKELPPDAVARIEKYKRFGSWVGVDLNTLADAPNSHVPQMATKEN